MKDICNKFIFIFVSICILLTSIIFLFKKPILFSENENRYLASFPKITLNNLKNNKVTRGLEDYINDHFPWRDFLVGIKTKIEVLLGKTKINDIYIAEDDYLIPAFIKNNDSEKIIKTLNDFVTSSDVLVELMLVPNSIQIYIDKLPINNEKYDGILEIENIYSKFLGKSINVHDTLLLNKNSENLYYRTDHHWTTHGAFIAYNEYRLANYLNIKNADNYDIKLLTDKFYGTSYSKSNYYNIKPDEIYAFYDKNNYLVHYVVEDTYFESLYNLDYLNKKDKYSLFLDNNHALIEINNLNNNSEENLLLIKNSYGNSFAPFIAADFNSISVIDLRYYKGDVLSYIKEKNIDKVLILYDINGIYTDPSIFKLGQMK